MNSSRTTPKLWIYSFFILISLALVVVFALPNFAQIIPTNGSCSGGTPGIGGPNFPDLPSSGFLNGDGCVNETDLSVLLGCWGSTLANPNNGCRVDQQLLFTVNISPSPDTLFQGGSRAYEVRANGGNGVSASAVNFSVSECPSGATCTLSSNSCNMSEGGNCSVMLNLSNTGNLALGPHQASVLGTHVNEGLSDDGILDLTITPQPNMFVTSGFHNGNLGDWISSVPLQEDCGGVTPGGNNANTVANCICTHYAKNSSTLKPGEYHAWISYNQYGHPYCNLPINAIDNIRTGAEDPTMPLVRTDGAIIADNYTALSQTSATNHLQNPINRNEYGSQVAVNVWTGTGADGGCVVGTICDDPAGFGQYPDWVNINGSAHYGISSHTSPNWTDYSSSQCNASYHLYCVYYDSDIPPEWGGIQPIMPSGNPPAVTDFNVTLGSAIITWTVESYDGALSQIEIWRAPDVGGNPGTWTELTHLRQDFSTQETFKNSNTAVDNPAPGKWWYGLHAADVADQIGTESSPIMIEIPDTGPVIDPSPVPVSNGNAWFVDNALPANGNGQSWTTAWNSFGGINWSSIQPDDIIYISGGNTSKNYNEVLNTGKSGMADAYITITKGVDAGHNGDVNIDANGSYGVALDSDYIRVSGLRFFGKGVDVDGSTGSVVENNYIYFDAGRGVFIQNSDNIIVRNNYMETPDWVDAQTDGIYSQRNHNNIYENNTIIINNQEPSGHDDCIQLYDDHDIIVRNNYLEQNNDKSGNAQGLYATTMHGTSYFYNNVVNLGNAQSNALSFRRLPSLGGDGTVEIIGNSIYGIRPYHGIYVTETNGEHVVKNNIVHTLNDIGLTLSGTGDVSNNYIGDPQYFSVTDKDFRLQSGSPVIDGGVDLGPPFNLDKNGKSRVNAWDIGAYEMN